MGQNNLKVTLALRKNENLESPAYGKYYPKIVERETLSQSGFARHIREHGLGYPEDIINGVLERLSMCIPELVGQGVSVKLDGIGTFLPYVKVAKGKAVVEIKKGLNPNELVKGVYIRFLPESTSLNDITSRAFKQKCALSLEYVEEPVKNQQGKVVGKKLIEIPAWIDQNSGDGGDGGGEGD